MFTSFIAHGGTHGLPIPVHPLLVNFTAALAPVSVACDLLGARLRKPSLLTTGWWTLLVAAITTPFTAAAGWYWMASSDHAAHWQMGYHQWLGVSLVVLMGGLALWRGLLQHRGRAPGWGYAIAAFVLLAALAAQGELGASMSFGRGILIPAQDVSQHHDEAPSAEHHMGEGEAPETQPSGAVERNGHVHH